VALVPEFQPNVSRRLVSAIRVRLKSRFKKSDKFATQLKAQGDLIGLISFQIVFGLGLAKV